MSFSTVVHGFVALAKAGWLATQPRERLGSDAMEVDLLSPNLAAPTVNTQGSAGAGEVSGPVRPGQSRTRSAAVAASGVTPPAGLAQATSRSRRRTIATAAQPAGHRNPTLPHPGEQESSATSAGPELAGEAIPRGPDPTITLATVRRQQELRKVTQQAFSAQRAAAEARFEARFRELVQATGRVRDATVSAPASASSANRAAGSTVAGIDPGRVRAYRRAGADQLASSPRPGNGGQGNGLGQARTGRAPGAQAPEYGLKFYLTGRRVAASRVVVLPALITMPEQLCHARKLLSSPATVRMLIDTQGTVAHHYLLHSSGDSRLDQCALKTTLAMRFVPGKDQTGLPLNVWINVRVEPSTSFRFASR